MVSQSFTVCSSTPRYGTTVFKSFSCRCRDLGFGVEFFLMVVALSVFVKLLPLSLHW